MEAPAAAQRGNTLFRPEVLAARQTQWLGSIRLARPLSFSVATAISVVLAALLMVFAATGEMSRRVTVRGVLLPTGGLLRVSAQQSGFIAEAFVKEGDEVRAGQPLLRLRSARILSNGGDADLLNAQALAARRASLDSERRLAEQSERQREEAINQRLQSLRTEERQSQAELEAHRLRVRLATKSLERQTALAQSGFVSPAQAQQKQEELLDLQLRERSAERNLEALQRDVQSTMADKAAAENQGKTALTQIERAVATLDQEATENEARSALTVTAPQGGRVSAWALDVGQTVQPGQTLLNLLPASEDGASHSELQAQLFVPSRTAGFVKPGQTVWLRYAAFPYQKFGMAQGTVMTVGRSPIAPQDLPYGMAASLMQAGQPSESLYRVTVRLPSQAVTAYGRNVSLEAGTTLDADVRLENRKVWEWILEPVLALSRRTPLGTATAAH